MEATQLPRWGTAEDARDEENRVVEARRLALEKEAEKIGAAVTDVAESGKGPLREEAEGGAGAAAGVGAPVAEGGAAADHAEVPDGRVAVDPSEDPLRAMEASLAVTEKMRVPDRSSLPSPASVLSNSASGTASMPFPSATNQSQDCPMSGDICRLSVDAIVNTTNERLDEQRGISGRIFRNAGPKIFEEVQRCAPEELPPLARQSLLTDVSSLCMQSSTPWSTAVMKNKRMLPKMLFTVATAHLCEFY